MKTLLFSLLTLAACAPKVEVTLFSIAGVDDPVLTRVDFVVTAGDRIGTTSEQDVQLPRIQTLILPEGFDEESLTIEAIAFIDDIEVGRSAVNLGPGQPEANLFFPLCSNSAPEAQELCDDGNLTDADGCDSTCKPTGCNSDVFTPGEVCFSTQNPVVANAAPSDVKAADMNGDQLLDLVASYPSQQQIRIFLSTADNQFGNFVDIPDSLLGLTGTGDDIRRISVSDIDNDGTPDIATSIKVGGAVFVGAFLSKGDETFSAGDAVFAGNDIRDVALADLDGDQLPEIIALDFQSDTLRTFQSLGSGDFDSNPSNTIVVGDQPVAFSIADLDQDSDLDVITIDSSGTISILTNTAGILAQNNQIPTNGTPIAIATADFDGDGLLDIAVTKQAGGDFLSIFTQRPNTQPIDFNNDGDFVTPTNPRGLIAVDVDLDGDFDIAVTSESDSTVTILVNDGTAQFAPAEAPVTTTIGPKVIATGDINRDEIPDFVTTGRDLGLIFSTP